MSEGHCRIERWQLFGHILCRVWLLETRAMVGRYGVHLESVRCSYHLQMHQLCGWLLSSSDGLA